MIVALHVATGAVGGRLAGTPRHAVAVGLVLHLAGDLLPHRDFRSRTFELASGVAACLTLALRRGWRDPATVGAIAASIPDVEHVLPLPRPGGRKLFPSHRWSPLHQVGGVPASVQLAVAVALLAALLRDRT